MKRGRFEARPESPTTAMRNKLCSKKAALTSMFRSSVAVDGTALVFSDHCASCGGGDDALPRSSGQDRVGSLHETCVESFRASGKVYTPLLPERRHTTQPERQQNSRFHHAGSHGQLSHAELGAQQARRQANDDALVARIAAAVLEALDQKGALINHEYD